MWAGFPGPAVCLECGSALISLSVSIRLPGKAWMQTKDKISKFQPSMCQGVFGSCTSAQLALCVYYLSQIAFLEYVLVFLLFPNCLLSLPSGGVAAGVFLPLSQ